MFFFSFPHSVSEPTTTALPATNPDEINVDDAEADPNEIALDDDAIDHIDHIDDDDDNGDDDGGVKHEGTVASTTTATIDSTDDGIMLILHW